MAHIELAAAVEPSPAPPPWSDARQIRLASEVQARLLPRRLPRLATLECAALSLPAHGVGGDFFDFLAPSPRRAGLVLADISGNGVPAALMMAGLQATLRSHYALAVEDLASRLQSVNRLFCDCTAAEHFATLFLGEYDDFDRRLRYVNCGHPAPILLRGDGGVSRLESTATVLGAFDRWQCTIGAVGLAPGDTLLLFSDGVSEATDLGGEEFGEARLVEAMRVHRHRALADLLEEIVRELHRFAGGRSLDDVTLLAARSRSPIGPQPLRGRGTGTVTAGDGGERCSSM